MSIDSKRLAVDLEYWNLVAPEDAECCIASCFKKWVGSIEFLWSETDSEWSASRIPRTLKKYVSERAQVIMKPTPPPCNKQDLLTMGNVCEALYCKDENQWHTARIVGKDGQLVIGRWLDGPNYGKLFEYHNKKAFRLIKTPEQLQRDELVEFMSLWWQKGGFVKVAEAVIEKYTLEPKA